MMNNEIEIDPLAKARRLSVTLHGVEHKLKKHLITDLESIVERIPQPCLVERRNQSLPRLKKPKIPQICSDGYDEAGEQRLPSRGGDQDTKPIIRNSDEYTCFRAPLEPLSPKSPEAIELIYPISAKHKKWPKRWYKQKRSIKHALHEAKEDALRAEYSKEVCREWEKVKSKEVRELEEAMEVRLWLSEQRSLHRKQCSQAKYNQWAARKKVQQFKRRLRLNEKTGAFIMTKVENIALKKLEAKALSAEKACLLVLRNIPTLEKFKPRQHIGRRRDTKMLHFHANRVDDLPVLDKICAKIRLLQQRDKTKIKSSYNRLVENTKDGKMSKLEFVSMIGGLLPEVTESEAMAVFRQIDVDKSDSICFREFYDVVQSTPSSIVSLVKNADNAKCKIREKAMSSHYSSMNMRMPRCVVARLNHEKLYIAMHTWKAAFRGGMTKEIIKDAVDSQYLLKEGLGLLRSCMSREKVKVLQVLREEDRTGEGVVEARSLFTVFKISQGHTQATEKLQRMAELVYAKLCGGSRLRVYDLTRLLKAFDNKEKLKGGEVPSTKPPPKATKPVKPISFEEHSIKLLQAKRPGTHELERVDKKLESVLTAVVSSGELEKSAEQMLHDAANPKKELLKSPLAWKHKRKPRKQGKKSKDTVLDVSKTEPQPPEPSPPVKEEPPPPHFLRFLPECNGDVFKKVAGHRVLRAVLLGNYTKFAKRYGRLRPSLYVELKDQPKKKDKRKKKAVKRKRRHSAEWAQNSPYNQNQISKVN